MSALRAWYLLAVLSCAACAAPKQVGSVNLAMRSVLGELEDLRSATKVRILLVPQRSLYFVPVRASDLENFACIYESDAPRAIASLVDRLSTAVSESTDGESHGAFAPRAGVLFFVGREVARRLYFEDAPLPGRVEVRVEMNEHQFLSDPTIRVHLEAWSRRPDVKRMNTAIAEQETRC